MSVKWTIGKVTVAVNNTPSLLPSINLSREVYFNELKSKRPWFVGSLLVIVIMIDRSEKCTSLKLAFKLRNSCVMNGLNYVNGPSLRQTHQVIKTFRRIRKITTFV